MPKNSPKLIMVAQFAGPHGVRGEVKLKSFCNPPEACFTYGALVDAAGKQAYAISDWKPYKQGFIVKTNPAYTREFWAEIGAFNLYVTRDALPRTNTDEFYHADLEGLIAKDPDGGILGTIANITNFGAGDILEISNPESGATLMVPFTQDAVTDINLEQQYLVVAEPDIWA